MQKILKMAVLFLFTLITASICSAANPAYNMKSEGPSTSQVNVYNQSAYTYTVNATYMTQSGPGRKFVMPLNAYPQVGSSIQFPIVLPEYAVYLKIIRNIDGNIAYTGYLSSDDVYIQSGNTSTPLVRVNHR